MVIKKLCQSILSLYLLSASAFATEQFSNNFNELITQHKLPGAVGNNKKKAMKLFIIMLMEKLT